MDLNEMSLVRKYMNFSEKKKSALMAELLKK